MRTEVRLAGSGGQGLITAAVILAEAVALGSGMNVVQTQSYGPEARGGASKADVVISDEPIYYPKARSLDILIALTQEACDRYGGALKEGGILLVDEDKVKVTPTPGAVRIPVTRIVREQFGRETYANAAVLGALSAMIETVPEKEVKAALARRVPPATVEANLKAFALGVQLGLEARDKPPPAPAEADL
jgi:2-oxoglutarate ferredoxin oxidoreductase subunit gamma